MKTSHDTLSNQPRKRLCTSLSLSPNDKSSDNDEAFFKICKGCVRVLPRYHFSIIQWRKNGIHGGKCYKCLEQGECAECKKTLPKYKFAQEQWENGSRNRRCKECCETNGWKGHLEYSSSQTLPSPQSSPHESLPKSTISPTLHLDLDNIHLCLSKTGQPYFAHNPPKECYDCSSCKRSLPKNKFQPKQRTEDSGSRLCRKCAKAVKKRARRKKSLHVSSNKKTKWDQGDGNGRGTCDKKCPVKVCRECTICKKMLEKRDFPQYKWSLPKGSKDRVCNACMRVQYYDCASCERSLPKAKLEPKQLTEDSGKRLRKKCADCKKSLHLSSYKKTRWDEGDEPGTCDKCFVKGRKQCTICKKMLKQPEYSMKQWSLPKGSKDRICIGCMKQFPEEAFFKTCGACHQELPQYNFSEEQWRDGSGNSKCNDCLGHYECVGCDSFLQKNDFNVKHLQRDSDSGRRCQACLLYGDMKGKGHKKCLVCHQSLPLSRYLQNEWKQKDGKGSCIKCLYKDHKQCSKCQKMLQRSEYPKSEWYHPKGSHYRLCTSCMNELPNLIVETSTQTKLEQDHVTNLKPKKRVSSKWDDSGTTATSSALHTSLAGEQCQTTSTPVEACVTPYMGVPHTCTSPTSITSQIITTPPPPPPPLPPLPPLPKSLPPLPLLPPPPPSATSITPQMIITAAAAAASPPLPPQSLPPGVPPPPYWPPPPPPHTLAPASMLLSPTSSLDATNPYTSHHTMTQSDYYLHTMEKIEPWYAPARGASYQQHVPQQPPAVDSNPFAARSNCHYTNEMQPYSPYNNPPATFQWNGNDMPYLQL